MTEITKGCNAALQLLRQLKNMNAEQFDRARSAEVLRAGLAEFGTMSPDDAAGFSAVLSEYLVTHLLDMSWALDDFEAEVREGKVCADSGEDDILSRPTSIFDDFDEAEFERKLEQKGGRYLEFYRALRDEPKVIDLEFRRHCRALTAGEITTEEFYKRIGIDELLQHEGDDAP